MMNENAKSAAGAPKRTVKARPATATSRPRRRRPGRASSSPQELSRQRARKAPVPANSARTKRTVTAVSKVRTNADPDVLRRSQEKVSRPANKRVKPSVQQHTALPQKTVTECREKKIMSGILSALDENEKAPAAPAETVSKPDNGFVRPTMMTDYTVVSPAMLRGEEKRVSFGERPQTAQTPAPAPSHNTDILRKIAASEYLETKANAANAPSEEVRPDETDEISKISRSSARANTVICTTLIFGIGLALLFGPRNSGFINSENRLLAEKPEISAGTLSDGTYFTGITNWYTDTVAVREDLKPFTNGFNKLFGITLDDVKITGDVATVKKETLETSANTTTTAVTLNTDFKTTTTAADGTTVSTTKKKKKKTEKVKEVEANADGEWMGSVIVAGKGKNVRAMSAFYGTFDMGALYAEAVNKYREDLDSRVNIFTLNMPNSAAYYVPQNLADQFTSQHDCIKNIGNNLQNVINVDVYDALDEHTDEYIYSRTDHHWQPLGAYYAAKVFAEKAQFDCPDLSTYETNKLENFVGTMYAYSDYDEELNKNPDTLIYHKPDNTDKLEVNYYDSYFSNCQYGGSLFFDYASGVNCYSVILGTDDEIAEIKTDVHNGRTLVIIKDSYGNALVPYLTHGFEKIYVCDFRFFDINMIDFIEQVGATDLLFAVSLQAAHTETNITIINNIRIQNASSDSQPANAPAEVVPDVQSEDTPQDNYDEDNYNYEEW